MTKLPFYKRSWFLWVITILFTLFISVWQRSTGPTYPKRGKAEIGNEVIKYKLIRSDEVEGETVETEIGIKAPEKFSGSYIFKRFKSHDDWTEKPLVRRGEELILSIPRQPKAGKMEYQISITDGTNTVKFPDEPVVMRYKGVVPKLPVLLPHVLMMLLAMIFSTRAGLEAIFRRPKTFRLSLWTLIFLSIGGLILGPVMQKYAFDAYWTGWPFGHDLTDNKTIVAWIFWLIAVIAVYKVRTRRVMVIVAAIVLLAIYSIPHSMLGSELDHTKTEGPKTEVTE
jgi:hypothetical protein